MDNSTLPSILNDVIGPVMRGPSSSHTAASWRIARTGIQLLNDELKQATIELDKDGVWSSNYREQGTAMGMDGGLLGIEITDERIINPELIASSKGIGIEYKISSFKTDHTNTVRVTLNGKTGKIIEIIAISTGGGMFEIREFNKHPIRLRGDSYDCLVIAASDSNQRDAIANLVSDKTSVNYSDSGAELLIQLKSPRAFEHKILDQIRSLAGIKDLILTTPIMPVVSGNESTCPFTDPESAILYAESNGLSMGKMGLIYESCRSGLSEDDLINRMKEIIRIVENGIAKGLSGTQYQDRILHQQSDLIEKASEAGMIKSGPLVNNLIANITALMEAKSALEVIVAIPTAGACGTFGGTLKAFADVNETTEKEKVLAYFAGGLAGVYFAGGPGFSAEEHGCQVETGAAACMAAAAVADISGGTAKQAFAAASMALQNSIGLVCDPVADRVEVPCLGKNVTAGMNALAASSMAVSGFDQVIPLDQVIHSVKQVGKLMPHALCNTGKGGLAVTPAALKLKENLKK
ncbi:MAG TPA: serine dehydratase [Bacteroides sp.]|nr:serine dehydratase [Bacteroides sp.]